MRELSSRREARRVRAPHMPLGGERTEASMGAIAEKTIHFAGKSMGGHRHVCAFFDTPEEEYGVTLPFVREAIQRSECGFHIVDPALRSDYVGRIEGAGIPVTALERAGQFEVRSWEEAYLRGGS